MRRQPPRAHCRVKAIHADYYAHFSARARYYFSSLFGRRLPSIGRPLFALLIFALISDEPFQPLITSQPSTLLALSLLALLLVEQSIPTPSTLRHDDMILIEKLQADASLFLIPPGRRQSFSPVARFLHCLMAFSILHCCYASPGRAPFLHAQK